MTALHSLALGVGYVTLFLIAAWGLFIAVVGAINILKPVVEAPTGTSKVRPIGLTDASAPRAAAIHHRDGSRPSAPSPIGAERW